MSVFKRRKKDEIEVDETADLEQEETTEADAAAVAAPSRPQGPWDAADAPEGEQPRVDLGALQLPVGPGWEVRVELNPQGQVSGATIVMGESAMQLSVFAAPRTEGIWSEVRSEIATALTEGGGQATEAEGPFGQELQALVPTQVPDRGTMMAPARFLGVDGPRWFLRALVTGAAAADRSRAGELEDAFRGVVVVRGADPMAVRDPLELRLPPDAQAQAAQAAAERESAEQQDAEDRGSLPAMPERGPEITEVR